MKIDEREFTGISACKGKVSGIVRIVVNVTDIGEFKPGEIFVGNFFNWDKKEYVPLVSTAKAIVGDEGGVTSHVAIESRKYNIPCVVGTKVATRVLNDGDLIEVDADKGIIKIIRKKMKIDVLDKGYIEVVDSLGDDLTPVNAARVSFGGRSDEFTDKDRKLSKFLIKHKHFSPFRHQHVMMIIKAPEFVMRQWYKHVVGIETTSDHPTKDHAWNEISGRYVAYEDFYYPTSFRKQSDDNKQASEGEFEGEERIDCERNWRQAQAKSIAAYKNLIDMGMAKEQARSILPLTVYTQVWWTASFQSIMNFIELRDEKTAQVEIQEYARALKEIMLEVFPETTKIWSEVYWK